MSIWPLKRFNSGGAEGAGKGRRTRGREKEDPMKFIRSDGDGGVFRSSGNATRQFLPPSSGQTNQGTRPVLLGYLGSAAVPPVWLGNFQVSFRYLPLQPEARAVFRPRTDPVFTSTTLTLSVKTTSSSHRENPAGDQQPAFRKRPTSLHGYDQEPTILTSIFKTVSAIHIPKRSCLPILHRWPTTHHNGRFCLCPSVRLSTSSVIAAHNPSTT